MFKTVLLLKCPNIINVLLGGWKSEKASAVPFEATRADSVRFLFLAYTFHALLDDVTPLFAEMLMGNIMANNKAYQWNAEYCPM